MKKSFQWNTLVSRRETILWGVLFVVIVIFSIRMFVIGKSGQISDYKAQIDIKQMELSSLEKLAQSQKDQTQLPNIYREIVRDKVEKFFQSTNLTPDLLISELMGYMTRSEFASLAMVEGFQFDKQDKKAGYSEMKFKLSMLGEYSPMTQFINKLKKLPYLLSIESIQVNRFGGLNNGRIKLVATVVIYISDSKKKPKGQELENSKYSDKATDLLLDFNAPSKAEPFATKPRGTEEWSVYELTLNGTIASAGGRGSALINGEVFEVGSVVAGYRIAEIRPREVVLQRRGSQHILRMPEDLGASADGSGSDTTHKKMPAQQAPVAPSVVNSKPSSKINTPNTDQDNDSEAADEDPNPDDPDAGYDASAAAPDEAPPERHSQADDQELPPNDEAEQDTVPADEDSATPPENKIPSSQQAW